MKYARMLPNVQLGSSVFWLVDSTPYKSSHFTGEVVCFNGILVKSTSVSEEILDGNSTAYEEINLTTTQQMIFWFIYMNHEINKEQNIIYDTLWKSSILLKWKWYETNQISKFMPNCMKRRTAKYKSSLKAQFKINPQNCQRFNTGIHQHNIWNKRLELNRIVMIYAIIIYAISKCK